MTDNAKLYGSRTPQDEWAYAHSWPSSHHRREGPDIIRPLLQPTAAHGSLGDGPPISRVHNLSGQDT